MRFPETWKQLREDMINCEQTPGQNMLEHGEAVWKWYDRIRYILDWGSDTPRAKMMIEKLKLPNWFFEFEEGLAWNRLSCSRIWLYTRYHDLGKPYCRVVDEEGKQHFPNHAEVSYQVWMKLNRLQPDILSLHRIDFVTKVGNLIRRDMEIHTIKASEVEHFCRDKYEAVTLLLVGLAEIHANAEMFGGVDSTSFKIKWKQLDRRGRAICKYLKLDEDI